MNKHKAIFSYFYESHTVHNNKDANVLFFSIKELGQRTISITSTFLQRMKFKKFWK